VEETRLPKSTAARLLRALERLKQATGETTNVAIPTPERLAALSEEVVATAHALTRHISIHIQGGGDPA
jgi:hypothetical protein